MKLLSVKGLFIFLSLSISISFLDMDINQAVSSTSNIYTITVVSSDPAEVDEKVIIEQNVTNPFLFISLTYCKFNWKLQKESCEGPDDFYVDFESGTEFDSAMSLADLLNRLTSGAFGLLGFAGGLWTALNFYPTSSSMLIPTILISLGVGGGTGLLAYYSDLYLQYTKLFNNGEDLENYKNFKIIYYDIFKARMDKTVTVNNLREFMKLLTPFLRK